MVTRGILRTTPLPCSVGDFGNLRRKQLGCKSSELPCLMGQYYQSLTTLQMRPTQVAGQVLTREDRLMVFSNVLQHCVQPFQLADTSKPGHRKILALFLADPSIRIPSTANVPPQQRDWCAKQIDQEGLLNKLPPEVEQQVYDGVEDFPLGIERAKEVRAELMAERGAHHEKIDSGYNIDESYCFCEHRL